MGVLMLQGIPRSSSVNIALRHSDMEGMVRMCTVEVYSNDPC